jgi:hypothetical protein
MGKLFYLAFRRTPYYMYHVMREQKSPADKSNRFWKPILFWLACTRYEQVVEKTGFKVSKWEMAKLSLTREDLFTEAFPFLKYDIWVLLVENFKEPKKDVG